jgi:hypothetical protein
MTTTVIKYINGIQYVSIFNRENKEMQLIKFDGKMINLN